MTFKILFSLFIAPLLFLFISPFLSVSNLFQQPILVFLHLWSLSLFLSTPFAEIRSKHNQMEAYTTLQKAAGALNLSLTHKCTHVLRAVLIAVGSLSVCTYILGGQLIELGFVSSGRQTKRRKMSETGRQRERQEKTNMDIALAGGD